ncbi:MAG: tRNA lysidine(34) synthetase TilS [Clostridia bacterium]|nr:tRNA lysidine(34) synthetase TilS [Clostridia bacterium]
MSKTYALCYTVANMEMDYGQLNKQSVVLAVSGGVDSMVMLDLFAKQYEGTFCVATVNHLIRDNALHDCNLVKQYCDKLCVDCTILTVDVPTHARDNKLSLETSARILRRNVLRQFAGGRVLCLAHNKNDQVETILMHILRGSGVKGGVGMSYYADDIYRPLLLTSRQDIEQYAQDNNVPYAHDYTNDDTSYKRNYVRHQVLPILTQVNPNALDNIAKFGRHLGEDEEMFRNIIGVIYVNNPPTFFPGGVTFDVKLLTLARSLSTRILFDMFQQLGYCVDIEAKHIEDIIGLANKQVSKSIDLPFGLTATRGYDDVTIEKRQEAILYCDSVAFGIGKVAVGNSIIAVSKQGTGHQFDIAKVPSDSCFRTRREGDMFTKFGGGTKKLKDYLIDKKIPVNMRDQLILLAHGQDILAIVGVEISDSIRTDNNSDIYKLTLDKKE